MKSLPIVSFIIPTFNRAYILPRAVKSLIEQTSSNWQLVVVDDGSTDHTVDVMSGFQKDERIIYIQQEHQGVSAARNSGAENAKGDHIIFLDSDDSFDSELLNRLNRAKFWECDLVFWQVLKIFENKKSLWQPKDLGKIYNNIKGSFLAGSVCYRKTLFIDVGKYDPAISFGENYELALRICRKNHLKIKYLNEPLLLYYVNSENRTEKFPDRLVSHIYQYDKHKELYLAHPTADAEMLRIIGFMYEKRNKRSLAIKYYLHSWLVYPWQLKPLLKSLYLKFIR